MTARGGSAEDRRPGGIERWFWSKVAETGFLERYPDFAASLAELEVVEQADEAGGVMGVSRGLGGRVRLHVRTAEFEEDLSGFRAILQHEMHHVLLGHVTDDRYRLAGPRRLPMLIATEVSANEGIVEELPGDPALVADYAELGLRPGQTTLERYALLVAAQDQGRLPAPLSLCGLCTGEHGDGDDLEALLLDVEELGDPELAELRRQRLAALRGLRARELELQPDGPPATIDWRGELRRFAAREPERRPSLRRPNRRDPTGSRIGELAGWTRVPVRPRLLVALDTSGSMPDDLFPRVASELDALSASADLVVVECDDAIRREYPYRGRLRSVSGRRGTDLRPVFEREVLARHAPDGVVYFTDGGGMHPPDDPGVETLWVLTDAAPFGCPWGRVVRMQ